jgi:hypothetical protein
MTKEPLAKLLPEGAARLLRQAALTPIPTNDPLARAKAVDAALERVKREYPKHFR